ncbi:hypothetical protein JZ751_013662 [Albula glossodonta]|uniref:Uncharacterized protein n=1 Tax=Albula glossodonta TaxID=121402 RepID=A0A8T2NVF5_9TELE|nr:hypothetical protein JZ751_013662 [Albula glossodonta]
MSSGGCAGIIHASFRYLMLTSGLQAVQRAASHWRLVELMARGPNWQSNVFPNQDLTSAVRDSAPLAPNRGRQVKSGGRDRRKSTSPAMQDSQPLHTTFAASPLDFNHRDDPEEVSDDTCLYENGLRIFAFG